MRWLVVLALLGACPGPSDATRSQPHPRVGGALSVFEASKDLDGNVIGPTDADATIVILMASWCQHCRNALDNLDQIRATHPNTRILGANYKEHEEYDKRGNAVQLRTYVTNHVPWLRVVPIDDEQFRVLGSPPYVPTIWIYDHSGKYVVQFDRRERAPPSLEELENALAKLGG
jgi:hypothetical protein